MHSSVAHHDVNEFQGWRPRLRLQLDIELVANQSITGVLCFGLSNNAGESVQQISAGDNAEFLPEPRALA